MNLLGNFLKFTYIENPGLAFSIRVPNIAIFTGISMVASLIVIYYIYKYRNESYRITFPLALILGGALGNLIDRLRFARVVDFIDVGVGSFRWPVFNVADSAVSIGLILFIYFSWTEKSGAEATELEGLDDRNAQDISPE